MTHKLPIPTCQKCGVIEHDNPAAVAAVSVVLDAERDRAGYTGTVFGPGDVAPEAPKGEPS